MISHKKLHKIYIVSFEMMKMKIRYHIHHIFPNKETNKTQKTSQRVKLKMLNESKSGI